MCSSMNASRRSWNSRARGVGSKSTWASCHARRGRRCAMSAPSLATEITREGDVAVVAVRGEIDMTTAQAFSDALVDALDGDPSVVRVDLSEVDFIDSSGVGQMVRCARLASESGARLEVSVGDGQVGRVLRQSGLADVLALRS